MQNNQNQNKGGIENRWFTQEKGGTGIINTSQEEWDAVTAIVAEKIKSNTVTIPFKLSKKEMQKINLNAAAFLNHGVMVISDPDNKPNGYKVGLMANGKLYINPTTKKEIKEGILGHGAFREVKLIQWQDNTCDAVKIEITNEKEDENKTEMQIMKDLGYLKEVFSRKRTAKAQWIGKQQIENKAYTIQKRLPGVDMDKYFKSINTLPSNKNNIALQAALSVEQMHNLNIIHCDIKPANFMLSYDNKTFGVAAVDFGFSTILNNGETVIEIPKRQGTPKYMAPEIKPKNKKQYKYSKALDIYALGVMFRDDMSLGGQSGDAFKDLIDRMTDDSPKKRPPISEVIATIQLLTEKKSLSQSNAKKEGIDVQIQNHVKLIDDNIDKIKKSQSYLKDQNKAEISIPILSEHVKSINNLCVDSESLRKKLASEISAILINKINQKEKAPDFLDTDDEKRLYQLACNTEIKETPSRYCEALVKDLLNKMGFRDLEKQMIEVKNTVDGLKKLENSLNKLLLLREAKSFSESLSVVINKLRDEVKALEEYKSTFCGKFKYYCFRIFSFGMYSGMNSKKANKLIEKLEKTNDEFSDKVRGGDLEKIKEKIGQIGGEMDDIIADTRNKMKP
jgi:serine/threonine protein kinase